MDKNFNFTEAEAKHYKRWTDANMFRAEVRKDKKPFTIIAPPPNITSRLHIGHAFGFTIMDSIIRFKRMQGFETLFLPGADHAAIATEVKVAEELRKQGIEKNSISREEFMVHVHKWYEVYMGEIIGQMKQLGLSCDWSRFKFTMDEGTTKAVKEAFRRLHEKKLIYQGERSINWCSTCKTALCESEVNHITRQQEIFHITYKVEGSETDTITIATVRPEVIFSAAAIAVHPNDKRFKKLIGKNAILPFIDVAIPIIGDECADMKFGTGAVQMTAHSGASHEFCARHGLKAVKVIDSDGKMIGERMREFAGMTVLEARVAVAKKLKDHGLMKSKKHSSNVGACYRCHKDIEPVLSDQWFMKMDVLAKPAIDALNNGLTIVPKKFEKVYLHWLRNIKDWCISRQLISGHKIPVEGCTDTLDTWFSSALWPFSCLGWPDKTDEMEYFYPTNVLVTAYDILFFWVIRMVFSGIEHAGAVPFDTALFHGLVRDMQGRKMSKSLGNGIDPAKVIEEFGADALRFSIITGTKLDRDSRYGMEKATLARNFINKIWNATKFYTIYSEGIEAKNFDISKLSTADKWILTKLNNVIKSTTKKYEKYDFGVAANDLESFFWHEFCDWYLEAIKNASNKETAAGVFRHVLVTFLKLINPIMPFVTEEIFCNVLGAGETLLFAEFPLFETKLSFAKDAKKFEEGREQIIRERSAKKDEEQRSKRIEHLQKEIVRSEGMLANAKFVEKAPKELVELEREKLNENKKLLENLTKDGR